MPRDPSILEVYPDSKPSPVVLWLDTDAAHFWRALKAHALHSLTPLFGNIGQYRAGVFAVEDLGYWWSGRAVERFDNEEIHTAQAVIRFETSYGEEWPHPRDAILVAWEMLAPLRLRVVVRPYTDTPGVIERTGYILRMIGAVFPEAAPQLGELDAVLKSWEYDPDRKNPPGYVETTAPTRAQTDTPSPDMILALLAPSGRATPEWKTALAAWYFDYSRTHRFTQADLARLAGYSLPHTKRMLAEYRAQHQDVSQNETE